MFFKKPWLTETPLFLLIGQHLWHRFGCNMLHTQIFSQNHVTHFLNANFIDCTVKRRFEWMTSQTFLTCWQCFNIESYPERESTSSEVWPSLSCFYNHEFEFGSWIHYQMLVLTFQMPLKSFLEVTIWHTHAAYEKQTFFNNRKIAIHTNHLFTLAEGSRRPNKTEWCDWCQVTQEGHCQDVPLARCCTVVLVCYFKSAGSFQTALVLMCLTEGQDRGTLLAFVVKVA
jgi:hypothetical protein